MFGANIQQVRVLCPICSIYHTYRVRVEQAFIDDNMFSLMTVRKPGDRLFNARLYCTRTGDEFHADVAIYETLHRRTTELWLKDTRGGHPPELVAWSTDARDNTAQPESKPRRGRRGTRLGRRARHP